MFWSPGHMPVPGRPAPESSLACAGVPGRAAAGALLPARASGAHRCPELSSPSPHVWPAPARTPRACWNRPAVSGEAQGEASGRKPTYLDDAVSFPDAPVLGCDAVRVDLEHTASISAPADTSAGVRTAAPHSHAHPCVLAGHTNGPDSVGGQMRPPVPSAGHTKPLRWLRRTAHLGFSASRADIDPEPSAAALPSVMRGTERRLRLSPGCSVSQSQGWLTHKRGQRTPHPVLTSYLAHENPDVVLVVGAVAHREAQLVLAARPAQSHFLTERRAREPCGRCPREGFPR